MTLPSSVVSGCLNYRVTVERGRTFRCHVIRVSLPRQARLLTFVGSAQPVPSSALVHRARLREHTRFWASTRLRLRPRSLAAPVRAVGLLWCSVLFAVDAQAIRAELSANLVRPSRSLRLAHALAPCCAATRRLCEARTAEQEWMRLR